MTIRSTRIGLTLGIKGLFPGEITIPVTFFRRGSQGSPEARKPVYIYTSSDFELEIRIKKPEVRSKDNGPKNFSSSGLSDSYCLLLTPQFQLATQSSQLTAISPLAS